jgi:RND family efflux transporter MFP subunit
VRRRVADVRRLALVALGLAAWACSTDAAGKSVPPPGSAAAGGDSSGARGGGSASNGGAGATARTPVTITLGASDVATVTRTTLEESRAITGNLEPVERVEVRARLEGDVVGVYAREGERVNAGTVLARFESSEQESKAASAAADESAAESDLATTTWNRDQSEALFKAGAISEVDVRAARQAVATGEARLAAAHAARRSAASALADTRVTAPTAGVVETRQVENGEHLARGASMFTVVRSDELELQAALPARTATGVQPGQVVHFIADGRSLDGHVARVSPTIDPVSRSVTVYVRVPNGGGALKGGTFATGRVVTRTADAVLTVAAAAVRQRPDDGTLYAYRIVGSTLDVAPVTIGIIDDARGIAEVTTGLNQGDRVVVGNVGTLGKGMHVVVAGTSTK